MTYHPEGAEHALVDNVLAAIEEDAPDAEAVARGLSDVSEAVLEKNADRLSEVLLWADPPMSMRILHTLPAAFTRRHVDNYLYYLNNTANAGFAAGAFVVFKARSAHRTNLMEHNLDKALWKWMRHADHDAIEAVLRTLGPDWGALWADYTAVVLGSGRLSRRLHREVRRMRDD
ncbi:MAG: hypothetical protein ACRDXX_13345 [Stackebrandtia sp.]